MEFLPLVSPQIIPFTPPRGFHRAAALKQARDILRRHGKSYSFSSRLFPRDLQESTWAVYAFVRLPDEIVDNVAPGTSASEVARMLGDFRARWTMAYCGEDVEGPDAPVLILAAEAWHRHCIPLEYSFAFLDAMVQDTSTARYGTYGELERYMYGSAAVIGLIMSHIIGFSQTRALHHARRLGEAMQLTNFLRDMEEDYVLRGRIYLPGDEMARFGVTDEHFSGRLFDERFRDFMNFQMERAQALYDEANPGIALLHARGRLAVAAASTLYRAILGRLRAQDGNPFAGRASTSKVQKVWLLGEALRLSRAPIE